MRLVRVGLLVGGGFVALIGIGHVFMPEWGYREATTATMSAAAKGHFLYLGTYAICAFLLGMAALAITYARMGGAAASAFSIVMTAVWTARLVLELVFPVELPIFFLERPHPVLVPILAAIVVAFGTAAYASVAALRMAPRGTEEMPGA